MRVFAAVIGAVLAPCLALGQAAPAAVAPLPYASPYSGPDLSFLNGTFQYGVSLSEIFQTGYLQNGDVSRQTSISGDVAYSTKSEQRPFNIIYSGGVQFSNQNNVNNTFFQSLALAQGYNTRNWNFGISDVVSYLPQSPTVGLSGIPGTGDLGLYPIEGVNSPSQSVLTYNETRVANSVSGSVSRRLSGRTSLSGDANYGLLHFFDQSALDTSQVGADVALNRTFDARTSGSLIANYSIFTYSGSGNSSLPGGNTSFQTRGFNVRVQRQLSRYLSGSVSAGPLWINSSSALGIPSRLSVSAGLNVAYTRSVYNIGLGYSRGANGGSGIQPGAITDSVGATYFRSFGRNWSASTNVGYAHTDGLSQVPTALNVGAFGYNTLGSISSVYAGAQASRRLGERFSAYTSYTASHQSYDNATNLGAVSPYALNGLVQSFSIGVSFFPRSVRLGQF